MSITIEGILQRVTLQNLMEKCTFHTEEETNFFKQYTIVEGILPRVEYLSTAQSLKKFPIYHITYDDTVDEFHLNVDYFDKENDTIMWISNEYKLLKWTSTFKKEYVLTYAAGSKIGNILKQKLPVILKRN